jgi:DHA1 family tetracycline resistance protein-like MFS transporter
LFGGYAFRRRELRLLYSAIFLSFLGASVVFPLRLLYAQAHHASPTQLGLMAAAFLIAPLAAQIPLGGMIDRWGRVPVLLVSLASHALVSLLYIFFNAPVELIALRFLEGLSTAGFQPAVGAYIADVTPEEHRAEAYGALSATLNAGMLVGPLAGGVVAQATSFAVAFAITVVMEVAAFILVAGRVHEPVVHERHGADEPPVSWRSLISLPLFGAYAAFFAQQTVMGILASLWTIWLHDLGGSYTYIGMTMTVFALPQIFLGALAGRLGDRWGRAPLLLGAGILVSVVYASYGFMTNLTLIVVVGIVEGIFIVFQRPAAQSLLADGSPSRARGRAQGVAAAAGALGGAVSAFASLPLYHQSRPLPFVIAGIAMTAGSVIAAVGAVALARRRRQPVAPAGRIAAR